jgi:hypothetical protein
MRSLAGWAWPRRFALCNNVGLWSQAGPAGWLVQLPLCLRFCVIYYCFLFLNIYQHCKRLIYTSCGTCIFIFKPVLGRVVFSLTFPWTCWFRNDWFWDGLQLFLPFNLRFLDMDGQKLCEKSTLVVALGSCVKWPNSPPALGVVTPLPSPLLSLRMGTWRGAIGCSAEGEIQGRFIDR